MDSPPHGGGTIAREVHFELSVAIAAVLEAKRLELVVALVEVHVVGLDMAPEVARRVLRAIDADETSHAVVSMHTEVVRSGEMAREWDADVEADRSGRAACGKRDARWCESR